MTNFLLIPWFIFWTILISQFGLMEPFKHKTISGQEIVRSREEVIQETTARNAKVEKLEKEANGIRYAYDKALRDCTGRSFNTGEGKSAGASYNYASYVFNTYEKTCYVTKMSGVIDGAYTYSFEKAYTVELPDYSLVYRK